MSQNQTTNFSPPVNPIYTSSDVSSIENKKRRDDILESLSNIGIAGGTIYAANKVLDNQDIQSRAQKIFKLNMLNQLYKYPDNQLWQDIKIKKKITLGDIALNTARAAEEISPFNILRTFHVSSFMSPIVLADNVNVHISGKTVNLDKDYYSELLTKFGNGIPKADHATVLKNGLIVNNGKLYSTRAENGKFVQDQLLIEHARLVNVKSDAEIFDKQGNRIHSSAFANRVYEKFRNIVGINNNLGFFKTGYANTSDTAPVGVIAGRTKKEMYGGWARAYGRLAMEPGYKIFDNPLEFMVEYVDNVVGDRSSMWDKLKSRAKLNLATAGDYTLSTPQSLLRSGKSILGKTALIGAAFYAADRFSREFAPEDSGYSHGILEGMSTSFVNARIKFAETWSDKFQEYKEEQEYVAPGSTSLLTLAGFPMAGAMAGGTYGYLKRAKDMTAGMSDVGEVLARYHTPETVGLLQKFNIAKTATPVKKYTMLGALAAAIPAIPYLPGALIGESSEKLKAEYSGEQDVAIKANRWWSSGSYAYEGTKTKYFAKNWYASMMSNAEDNAVYGSDAEKDNLNPFLHPFDYLRNPYRLEERNAESMPYPVWGMDVSYGSFFGKIYEKTLGRVIKPDIINPNLKNYTADTTSISTGQGLSFVGGGGAVSGEKDSQVKISAKIKKEERDLIESGLMVAPENPSYEPGQESLSSIYKAATDFAGLKGWVFSLGADAMGLDIDDPGLQLARSGEMTNMGRHIQDMNLGGMAGLTESQRRFVPTGAGSIYDRANPLKNNMPTWMPSSPDDFYIDFSIGNAYDKVEKGFLRLPGDGYTSIHTELQGLSPEDYPDIHKFKILSDIALGSNQYYEMKDVIDRRARAGLLTDYEQNIYNTIREQSQERSISKKFSDYREDSDFDGLSSSAGLKGRLWELITHNAELPTESLTFFRPAGKFIHQRTAIEDYEASQLYGNDIAMWTSPYSHFIKPTFNKMAALTGESFVPSEVEEKRNVNEYFEALDYVKWRRLEKQAIDSGDGVSAVQYQKKSETNVFGAASSQLLSDIQVTRAYMSLDANEKPYFGAFSNETDQEDRQKIINMLPGQQAEIFAKMWRRKDAIAQAIESGDDPIEATQEMANEENANLIKSNRSAYNQYKKEDGGKYGTFAEYVAEQDARKIVESKTGMPSDDFVGWDPRIDMNDIKLKTLSIGKEDVREYGFWAADEERLQRMIGITDNSEVVNNINAIKRTMQNDKIVEIGIKNRLHEQGIRASSIRTSPDKHDNFDILIEA